MIQKKLDELEALITVPNVDKSPEQSLKAMKALNLIVELRGLVKNLDLHIVSNSAFRNDMQKAFEAGEEYCNDCKCGECDYCTECKDEDLPDFDEWFSKYYC